MITVCFRLPVLLALSLAAGTAQAAESKLSFHPQVQERARAETLRPGTFADELVSGWQVSNRARLALEARWADSASAFVQLQDIRGWGSEYSSTLGEGTIKDYSADGFDLHQGYGQLNLPNGWLRVGRQEIGWHSKRLVGNPDWTMQGRSFDGLHLSSEGDKAGFGALYAFLSDRPVSADDASEELDDLHMVGLRAGPRLGDELDADALVLLKADAGSELLLATMGAHGKGKAGPLSWKAEAYYQLGQDADVSYAAWMAGLRAGVGMDGPVSYAGLGFDMLSGDADQGDDTVRVFDNHYAANHGKYGNLDVYKNIPNDTGGEGLVDGMLNLAFAPAEALVVKLDGHVFASAAAADPSTAFHGVEIDLNSSYKLAKPVKLGAGAWFYQPGPHWGDDAQSELAAYLYTDFLFK